MWWPWAVVWITTVVALAVAVGVPVWARHRYLPAAHSLGVPIHLDGPVVLDVMSVLELRPMPEEVTLKKVRFKDGRPDETGEPAHVRLECPDEWLRDRAVPRDVFIASCLGRVRSWRAADRQPEVWPIAMFR